MSKYSKSHFVYYIGFRGEKTIEHVILPSSVVNAWGHPHWVNQRLSDLSHRLLHCHFEYFVTLSDLSRNEAILNLPF